MAAHEGQRVRIHHVNLGGVSDVDAAGGFVDDDVIQPPVPRQPLFSKAHNSWRRLPGNPAALRPQEQHNQSFHRSLP